MSLERDRKDYYYLMQGGFAQIYCLCEKEIMSKSKKTMLIIVGLSVLMIAVIFFLVGKTISFAGTEFPADGYLLSVVDEDSPDDSVNKQNYFNGGDKFTPKYPGKVTFKDTNGDNVAVDSHTFIHYQSGSMGSFTRSVLVDTANLDTDALSYYSISNKSLLEKTANGYNVSNAGETVSFSHFIWKLSGEQYMAVSPEITLSVSDGVEQTFADYIEVKYMDEGVVYLINQEGTYSTVSSNAYLELQNGVRIYLGSKNVSNGDLVVMNLSQMIVDSDDNIEIIPDEEYKKENVSQPLIDVDVSDGQAGEPGESGEPGTSGNTGENGNAGEAGISGSPGAPGSAGSDGDDAENSDVIYNPEVVPIFTAELTPSSYGVDALIRFDDNETQVTKATVSIIEKSTGSEAWRKDITQDLASQLQVSCNTLKQSTEYLFVISSTYNDRRGESVTQDIYKRIFNTTAFGVSIDKKYVTEDAIVLNLTKENNSDIDRVRVKYFNEDMLLLGYGDGSQDDPLYDSSNQTFQIGSAGEGTKTVVEFNGLDRNTPYYMQIEVVSLKGGVDVSIVPTNSFALKEYKTLKAKPQIGKPTVKSSELTNSFVIESSNIVDPDDGIKILRYEIYEASSIVDGEIKGGTVLVKEKENGAALNLSIDGKTIRRETDYVARIVAIFDDNDGTVEYNSEFSEVFNTSASAWPTIENEIKSNMITASTVEGKLIVTDTSKIINPDRGLWIKYSSNTAINGHIREGVIDVSDEIIANGAVTGIYEIPYEIKALKSEQAYTISLYAGEINVEGEKSHSVMVGSKGFVTNSYAPLFIDSVVKKQVGENVFNVDIVFRPSNEETEEELRKNTSKIEGLENVGDMSGKSLTYVKFALYAPNEKNNAPSDAQLGVYGVTGIESKSYSAQQYMFDSQLYTGAYAHSSKELPAYYHVSLTEEDFGLTSDDLASYSNKPLYIKIIEAYDYTYGRGSGDRLYGNHNIIPVGTVDIFDGSVKDPYVEVEASSVLPNMPSAPYYTVDYLTKYKAMLRIDSFDEKNSNTIGKRDMQSMWDVLRDDNTDVGISVSGPASLAKYASAVKYTVYKAGTDGKEDVEITNSDWIDYEYNAVSDPTLPVWSFFAGIEGEDGEAVFRGETFRIKTEIKLKHIFKENGENYVFPTEIDNLKDQKIIADFMLEKETPSVMLIPYDAYKGESLKKDVFYITYYDVDNAIQYDDKGKLQFFTTSDGISYQPVDDLTLEDITSGDFNGYKQLSCVLGDDKTLTLPYDTGGELRYLSLISEADVIPKGEVVLYEDSTSVEIKNDENLLKIVFQLDAPSPDAVGRVDVKFETADKRSKIYTAENITYSDVEDNDGNTYYEATVEMPLSELVELAGVSTINFELYVYSDGGTYGLKNALTGNSAIGHYAMQDGSVYSNGTLGSSLYTAATSFTLNSNKQILTLVDGNGAETELTIGNTGINPLPKGLLLATGIKGTFDLEYVLPFITAKASPGYSVCAVKIDVGSKHTLIKDEGLVIKYRKQGATSWEGTETVSGLTSDKASYNIMLKNLENKTDYEYEIFGYAGKDKKEISLVVGNFTTYDNMDAIFNSNNISFVVSAEKRESKFINVNFRIKDIYRDDVEVIKELTLKVTDENGQTVSSDKISKKELLDAFEEISSGVTDEKFNLDYSARGNWEPDIKHEMSGNATYTVSITTHYEGEVQTSKRSATVTPQPWSENELKIAAIGSKGVTIDDNGLADFNLSFSMSGLDKNRILACDSTDKVTLITELYKSADGKLTAVEGTRALNSQDVDSNGNIMPKTITYGGLQPATAYVIKVYAVVDETNIGKECLDSADSTDCEEVYTSGAIVTAASSSINAISAVITPASKSVYINGENLEYVKKIEYTLANKTTGEVLTKVYKAGDSNPLFSDMFAIDAGSSNKNQYILQVPEMLGQNHGYTITINFYRQEDSTVQESSITASYGQNENTLYRLIRSLTA